tara:strand:+ start:1724 stop:2353 length:630 start_codon:yes stop_codon:yes gene_type:complete
MKYEKQVEKRHYAFESYFYPGRWMSYWYQIKEIVSRDDINSVLDVGPGTSVLQAILNEQKPNLSYQSLDIADDLHPDIKGSVTDIPLKDNAVDLATAFQVLEHISFDDFEVALQEMKRVSKRYVFISLPHYGPSLEFRLKLPKFAEFKFAIKLPRPITHVFCGQHYWEIGKKGYSASKIRSILNTHFDILDEYIPHENQYHRFYIMQNK